MEEQQIAAGNAEDAVVFKFYFDQLNYVLKK